MSPQSLTTALKQEAERLGFHLAGACPATRPPGVGRFLDWLAAGYAGEMHYLSDRVEACQDPHRVLEGAQSILMLGMAYGGAAPRAPSAGQGRVSRYAWGADYHAVIRARLRRLAEFHLDLTPGARVRGVVDTAPLLEREFARMAGLGWIGKNTMLLNRQHGSWFYLAALLTTETLAHDDPHAHDHCGACRACLDACPTGALVAPHQLDARKCISYLTIEHRGHVAAELREGLGDWLFGCDVCQEVCPWNRRAKAGGDASFAPRSYLNPVELAELFALDEAAFGERFRKTALWRAKRRGLLRNAAIVLGNRRHDAALPALRKALGDPDPVVRAACAWALSRCGA